MLACQHTFFYFRAIFLPYFRDDYEKIWRQGRVSMRSDKESRKSGAFCTLISIMLAFSLAACGGKPDISAYQDMPISITGLTEKDFEITPAELIKMDCASESDTGKSEKAGTVEGYGPTLDTFLAQYGKERSDFEKIRFIGKDGYKKTLWGEVLDNDHIVLSLSNGKEPLNDNETPLRLIVPDEESSYWVYGVTQIEFIAKDKK